MTWCICLFYASAWSCAYLLNILHFRDTMHKSTHNVRFIMDLVMGTVCVSPSRIIRFAITPAVWPRKFVFCKSVYGHYTVSAHAMTAQLSSFVQYQVAIISFKCVHPCSKVAFFCNVEKWYSNSIYQFGILWVALRGVSVLVVKFRNISFARLVSAVV